MNGRGRGIIVGRTAPMQQLCPRCGKQRVHHVAGLYACPVPANVYAAVKAFALANGKQWRSKLLKLWEDGGETEELRAARNMIGPSRLYKISVERPQ